MNYAGKPGRFEIYPRRQDRRRAGLPDDPSGRQSRAGSVRRKLKQFHPAGRHAPPFAQPGQRTGGGAAGLDAPAWPRRWSSATRFSKSADGSSSCPISGMTRKKPSTRLSRFLHRKFEILLLQVCPSSRTGFAGRPRGAVSRPGNAPGSGSGAGGNPGGLSRGGAAAGGGAGPGGQPAAHQSRAGGYAAVPIWTPSKPTWVFAVEINSPTAEPCPS